ncbi:hypothetical protein OAK51_07220 [Alphaproteobacteria bacterium]|nr:hypothetical protein [Alphaproteobacteria bacterium]
MIFGRIFIFIGILFFLLALTSNYLDISLQLKGKTEITEIGMLWSEFAPNSLQMAETIISRYVDPCSALEILNCSGFIWHPFVVSILLLPAAPFLAILSFISIGFGIKKSSKGRRLKQNKPEGSNRI